MENGIEIKGIFGMEYGRCSEWNGMEDLKNGMEDRLPYLPNSELHPRLHILKLITNHKLIVMRLLIRQKRQQDYLCELQYLA